MNLSLFSTFHAAEPKSKQASGVSCLSKTIYFIFSPTVVENPR